MDVLAIILAIISILITITGGAIILRLQERFSTEMQTQQQRWQDTQARQQQSWELRQEQRIGDLETKLTAQLQQQRETLEVQASPQAGAGTSPLSLEHELTRVFRVDELPLAADARGQRRPAPANWRPPMLYRANLSGRDLSNHSFRHADLREAELVGSSLFLSDFTEACLSSANLSGADLSGANMTGADLRNSTLTEANLLVADLHGAILIGANLLGARGLTVQQVEMAIYDATTRFDEEIRLGLPNLSNPENMPQTVASTPPVETGTEESLVDEEESTPVPEMATPSVEAQESTPVPEMDISSLEGTPAEGDLPDLQQPGQPAITPVDLQVRASQPVIEAYCVRCKKKVEMQSAHPVTLKNGRTAMQGTCPFCGTKLFRIGQF